MEEREAQAVAASSGTTGEAARIADRLRLAIDRSAVSIRGLHRELHRLKVPGSSYPSIHRYLRGESQPPNPFVVAAAELLGVRVAWLAAAAGPMTEEEERDSRLLEQFEARKLGFDEATRLQRQRDYEIIAPLLEASDHVAFGSRMGALLRFAQKLDDADVAGAPWSMREGIGYEPLPFARNQLLECAARFLVTTEAAFDDAGRQRGPGGEPTEEFWDALLLRRSSSVGANVEWRDAILNLFARRVKGLGERTGSWLDAHAPSMADRARDYQL